jgi:hypothetical protein
MAAIRQGFEEAQGCRVDIEKWMNAIVADGKMLHSCCLTGSLKAK